nr:hypothetical protein [Candidatus Levybacteria bacterium]
MKTPEKRTGMEEAIIFSRNLPQVGIHPENILELGEKIKTRMQEGSLATPWEQARAKTMQNK